MRVLGRFGMLVGMTMNRRRLMVAIGAVLFGGGLAATWTFYNPPGRIIGVAGVVAMAVGAGLIAFAVLRPTNPKDD